MKKYTLSTGLLLSGLAMVAMTFSGCSEEPDTIAKVIVLDNEGIRVSGAQVALTGEPSDDQQGLGKELTIADTTSSNAAGEAIFNLNAHYKSGQAGVAVLNVTAVKDDASGQAVIKVEEQTTSEVQVFIGE